MNERQKAKELISKANRIIGSEQFKNESKEIALLCVDEILLNIEATKLYHKDSKALPVNEKYWKEVKQEISLL